MQVRTDDGKEATIFSPAAVGDDVLLTYSEKYKNYSAEKMTAAKQERNEIVGKLDRILELLEDNPFKSIGRQGKENQNLAGSPGQEYKRVQTPPYATQEPESPSAPADDELPPTHLYEGLE